MLNVPLSTWVWFCAETLVAVARNALGAPGWVRSGREGTTRLFAEAKTGMVMSWQLEGFAVCAGAISHEANAPRVANVLLFSSIARDVTDMWSAKEDERRQLGQQWGTFWSRKASFPELKVRLLNPAPALTRPDS